MTGEFKVVGTNKTTKEFEGVVFEGEIFETEFRETLIRLDEKDYWIQTPSFKIFKDFILISGVFTDGETFVGRISIEFFPKNS